MLDLSLCVRATTLNDFVATVWFPISSTKAPGTDARYRGVYRKFIQGTLGTKEFSEINVAQIRKFVTRLDGETPHTKAFVFSVLRNILGEAERHELIARNPCSLIRVKTPRVKRKRVIDLDPFLQMLEAVRSTPLSAPVFLSSVLGLRRGEVLGLKWDHLDPLKQTLTIEVQRQFVSGKGVIERDLKTAGSYREVHLPRFVIDEIYKRCDLDSPYLCTNGGLPWTPNTVTELWIAMRKELGFENWKFHDLRHQAAGMLAAAGCNLMVIGAILGHKSPDITAMYVAISEERIKEGADKLSNYLTR